jgi:hypothetical protein
MSDTIGAHAAALAKAQTEFDAVLKNAKNPHLKNRYADLESVLSAVRPALGANGLSVIQGVGLLGDDPCVQTRICHESGEWVETDLPLLWERQGKGTNDAQRFGGGLTYARRYAFMAALGLAPEDDDGCSAGEPGSGRATSQRREVERPVRTPQPPVEDPKNYEPENRGGKPWATSANLSAWLTAHDVPPQAYIAWREATDKGELDLGNEWHVGGAWVKLLRGEMAQVVAWMSEQHGE